MFNTLRGPLFGTFLPYHVAPASLFLTKKKKSPKRLLTGGEWVFYFPRLKKKTLKSLQSRRHSGSRSWSVAAINVSHFEPAKRK